MSSLRCLLVCALVLIVVAPACGPPRALCGEGEGENEFFGPTLDGDAAPANFGILPRNGILHASVRNQGALVTASLRMDVVDSTERPIDVDEVGLVLRVLLDELVADTSYVATLRIDPAEAPNGALTTRELSFTTTDVVDNTPPAFQGEPTFEAARSVDGVECSGRGTLVNILAPDILDDTGVAGVKVFALDEIDGERLVGFHVGTGNVVHKHEVGFNQTFGVVAVDFAGNESEQLGVDVNVESSSPGCAASAGSPTLAVLAVLLHQLRCRRRSPPSTKELHRAGAALQIHRIDVEANPLGQSSTDKRFCERARSRGRNIKSTEKLPLAVHRIESLLAGGQARPYSTARVGGSFAKSQLS